ncbi:hypothetical protein Q2T40_16195 [Winogradskyella maritima]|uniref:Uncharacterized protein n=1 Tax=Winogradskyella maritima TaxID=1517766 RepID=A0ABV8AGC5_9FLAO|nr:hypothetical protein [Winogradskyella maritima]
MNNDEEDIFNFKDEASKQTNYHALIPKRREGIVILHLYDGVVSGRYDNGRFTGDEIHRLFEVTMTAKEKRTKYVKSYNKNRIIRLQKFFLSYDEETRTYSFQEYGLNFCETAKETLAGSFEPTEIQVICSSLKKLLNEALEYDEALKEWFEIHFKYYHPTLKKHIDYLDRQIDDSVSKLRKDTLAQNIKPLQLLENVSDDLKDVQKKNEDLRGAFNETNSISQLLTEIDTDNRELLDLIEEKVQFFEEIQRRLRGTDRRLDRIQPKIKQLFAAFRNPEYSAQTDRFIRFLLKYSTLKKASNDKQVVFPKEIPNVLLKFKRPRHIHFDRDRDLFPTRSKPRTTYEPDLEAEKENQAILDKAYADSESIENWVNLIFAELRQSKQLNLSEMYFRVLKDSTDFTIATKVFFNILDIGYDKEEYHIEIDKNKLVKQEGLILWNTILTEH